MSVTVTGDPDRKALNRAMHLSLMAGLVMFALKGGAYWLTGSAAILSDAAESVVHVAAVCFAAYSLSLSYRPADESHPYGHAKIAFFSAGFEGAMILLAAVYIVYQSIAKWINGLELERLGLGTTLTAAAAVINGSLGTYLLWTGRRQRSLILEANGKHVLTDCWTSLAVLIGLGLVLLTGWLPFDPLCGLAMALNIFISGLGLIRSACLGLMDSADPAVQKQIDEMLEKETAAHGITYHSLRHRNLGDAHWVEVHLLFPEGALLDEAHRIATEIEHNIESSLKPKAYVNTHLESLSDHDQLHPLERSGGLNR